MPSVRWGLRQGGAAVVGRWGREGDGRERWQRETTEGREGGGRKEERGEREEEGKRWERKRTGEMGEGEEWRWERERKGEGRGKKLDKGKETEICLCV